MMISVIAWILAGCVTAGCVAWVCDVWTEKKISQNLLVGLILCIVMGWVGLAVMILLASLASIVVWFEKHGSGNAISWGKNKDVTLKTGDGDVEGEL